MVMIRLTRAGARSQPFYRIVAISVNGVASIEHRLGHCFAILFAMARPRQQDSEPISEERFEAAVKKLLATPPRPQGKKKPARKRKAVTKPKRG